MISHSSLLNTLLLFLLIVSPTNAQWSITSLTTFSPSGRPGSSPYSVLNTSITDKHGYYDPHVNIEYPSTAICVATWLWGSKEITPYNIRFNCTNTDSNDTKSSWFFEVQEVSPQESEYPSPITDFYLQFWRVIQGSDLSGHDDEKGGRRRSIPHSDGDELREGIDKKAIKNTTYTGGARFTVGPGENMEGICGASGVCAFNLREERIPFLIERHRVI